MGLKLYELLTLIGIFLGPIIAVVLTLWIEGSRREHDQKVQVLKALLTTRHLPGDPAYSVAINMIPVEFNKNRTVMAAWQNYMEAVRYRPSPENAEEHLKVTLAKQTKLIFEVMRGLRFKLAETDIQTTAYAADGFIQRDNVFLDAWKSWPRIAVALELNNAMLAGMADKQEQNEN
jgi:hypothetical protein